jgi:hypothetical protein
MRKMLSGKGSISAIEANRGISAVPLLGDVRRNFSIADSIAIESVVSTQLPDSKNELTVVLKEKI